MTWQRLAKAATIGEVKRRVEAVVELLCFAVDHVDGREQFVAVGFGNTPGVAIGLAKLEKIAVEVRPHQRTIEPGVRRAEIDSPIAFRPRIDSFGIELGRLRRIRRIVGELFFWSLLRSVNLRLFNDVHKRQFVVAISEIESTAARDDAEQQNQTNPLLHDRGPPMNSFRRTMRLLLRKRRKVEILSEASNSEAIRR